LEGGAKRTASEQANSAIDVFIAVFHELFLRRLPLVTATLRPNSVTYIQSDRVGGPDAAFDALIVLVRGVRRIGFYTPIRSHLTVHRMTPGSTLLKILRISGFAYGFSSF